MMNSYELSFHLFKITFFIPFVLKTVTEKVNAMDVVHIFIFRVFLVLLFFQICNANSRCPDLPLQYQKQLDPCHCFHFQFTFFLFFFQQPVLPRMTKSTHTPKRRATEMPKRRHNKSQYFSRKTNYSQKQNIRQSAVYYDNGDAYHNESLIYPYYPNYAYPVPANSLEHPPLNRAYEPRRMPSNHNQAQSTWSWHAI